MIRRSGDKTTGFRLRNPFEPVFDVPDQENTGLWLIPAILLLASKPLTRSAVFLYCKASMGYSVEKSRKVGGIPVRLNEPGIWFLSSICVCLFTRSDPEQDRLF
jgi:hypothetical protein